MTEAKKHVPPDWDNNDNKKNNSLSDHKLKKQKQNKNIIFTLYKCKHCSLELLKCDNLKVVELSNVLVFHTTMQGGVI